MIPQGVPPEQVRAALTGVLPGAMSEFFAPDACAAAARIVLDVLAAVGIPGRPVPVVLYAENPEFTALVHDAARLPPVAMTPPSAGSPGGPWLVVVGDPEDAAVSGGGGHVVVWMQAADGDWLLDVTAGQADRPHKNLKIGPLALDVAAESVGGPAERKVSKNARVIGSGANKPLIAPESHLVISCNGGRHAYILEVESQRNVHAATDSDTFWDVVAANVGAGYGKKLESEFADLAGRFPSTPWEAARRRLAGILQAAQAAA